MTARLSPNLYGIPGNDVDVCSSMILSLYLSMILSLLAYFEVYPLLYSRHCSLNIFSRIHALYHVRVLFDKEYNKYDGNVLKIIFILRVINHIVKFLDDINKYLIKLRIFYY